MRSCRSILLLVATAAVAVSAPAELQTGRQDVLLNLHACNVNGSAVTQLAPLVHWLGATVEQADGLTVVRRGDRSVALHLPRQRADGRGVMVRLRDVVEPLGATLSYHPWDSEEAARVGHIPHVRVEDGDRVGRILIHAAPPDIVANLIADAWNESFGRDWLLQVSALSGEWAKTHEPQWDGVHGFSQRFITGVLHREDGHWRYRLRSSRVSHTAGELAEAGVPIEVARALEMQLQ